MLHLFAINCSAEKPDERTHSFSICMSMYLCIVRSSSNTRIHILQICAAVATIDIVNNHLVQNVRTRENCQRCVQAHCILSLSIFNIIIIIYIILYIESDIRILHYATRVSIWSVIKQARGFPIIDPLYYDIMQLKICVYVDPQWQLHNYIIRTYNISFSSFIVLKLQQYIYIL